MGLRDQVESPQDSERGKKNLERSKNGQCAVPRTQSLPNAA